MYIVWPKKLNIGIIDIIRMSGSDTVSMIPMGSKVFEYIDPKKDITDILLSLAERPTSNISKINKLKYYVEELDLDILLSIGFNITQFRNILKLYSTTRWYYNNPKSDILFKKYNGNFLNLLILIYTEENGYRVFSNDFYNMIQTLYKRMSDEDLVVYEGILSCFNKKIYKLIGYDTDFQNYIKNNKELLYDVLFVDRNSYNFYIFDLLIKEYDKEFIDNNIDRLLIFHSYNLLYSKTNITTGFTYLIKNKKLTITSELLRLVIAGQLYGVYKKLYSVISNDLKCDCLKYYCMNLTTSNGLSSAIVKKIKIIINDLSINGKLPDKICESDILFILTGQYVTNGSSAVKNILEIFNLLVNHGVNIRYVSNNMTLDDYIFSDTNSLEIYKSSIYILKIILDYYKSN